MNAPRNPISLAQIQAEFEAALKQAEREETQTAEEEEEEDDGAGDCQCRRCMP